MKKYRFKARIEPGDRGGAFVFFPYDVMAEFGTAGRVPVKATFDGVADTGSLAKYGHPQHLLGVRKAIRDEIAKQPGDLVDVVVWKDEQLRTVEIPPEFLQALQRERLLAGFEKLSYTHRKEYCRWIAEAKREDTRARRLDQAVQLLKQGKKTPSG